MELDNTLFDEDIEPDETASVEPYIEEDESETTDMPTEWEFDPMPLEVILNDRRSVAKLIRYAVRSVNAGQTKSLNKRDLGAAADTTRHAVHRHIDELVELGIYTKHDAGVDTYAPNPDGVIVQALSECNDQIEDRLLASHNVLELPD